MGIRVDGWMGGRCVTLLTYELLIKKIPFQRPVRELFLSFNSGLRVQSKCPPGAPGGFRNVPRAALRGHEPMRHSCQACDHLSQGYRPRPKNPWCAVMKAPGSRASRAGQALSHRPIYRGCCKRFKVRPRERARRFSLQKGKEGASWSELSARMNRQVGSKDAVEGIRHCGRFCVLYIKGNCVLYIQGNVCAPFACVVCVCHGERGCSGRKEGIAAF
jgi:hypothetical protein